MRVFKRIDMNKETMERVIKDPKLIKKAVRWIEEYNYDENEWIEFTYACKPSKLLDMTFGIKKEDLDCLDAYFIGELGMSGTINPKLGHTSQRLYFYNS